MNATTRFLTTLSVTNVFCRNIHSALHQGLKIVHMTEVPLKHLLLKNLRKSASAPEALFSTYVNLVDSISNPGTHQEFTKGIMEPYLDSCFISKDVPSTSPFDFVIDSCSGAETSSENIAAIFTHEMDINKSAEPDESFNEKSLRDMQRYNAMRKWKRFGEEEQHVDLNEVFILRLISFNILAQNLLEAHQYLYSKHDKEALHWNVRKNLLTEEILGMVPNVICLQEMQEENLVEFLIPFQEKGYDHLYKKRTNDKADGLLLMFRADQLVIVDYVMLEMHQSGIELLSRDNVALIVKFALKDSPETQIVIATTHLLYNPKRNDVRLGQTQLLLSEIERVAFIENTMNGPKYLPIILSGDFNLEPHTGVYNFLTQGHFTYQNKGRNLESIDLQYLTNLLIPPHLHITDECQHFNVLVQRLRGEGTGKVMLENKQERRLKRPREDEEETLSEQLKINTNTEEYQKIEIDDKNRAQFSSGTLTHPFKFRSVYKHKNYHVKPEATTHQNKWITVDYIFFTELEPLEKYSLPTVEECTSLPTIPNFAVGSDHLCVAATFKVLKKKTSSL